MKSLNKMALTLIKRNSWTQEDNQELEACYSKYPLILPDNLLERHGRAGCYSRADRLKLGHKLRGKFLDLSSWPETTKAYLAGIIDGEGTITITKNIRKSKKTSMVYYYHRPVITISNTDLNLLSYLKSLNTGGFSCDKRRSNGHWKPAYQWTLAATKPVYSILKAIHPYLVIKKHKAEEVMVWIEQHKEF